MNSLAEVIATAVIVWTAVAFTWYALLRKITYSLLDPVAVIGIFVAFSGTLLLVLCTATLIPWDKMLLFSVVLAAYLLGARMVAASFSRTSLRRAIIAAVMHFKRHEITAILLITVCVTLILAVLGIQYGAQGDASQQFSKVFRPIVVLHSGLLLFSLILLLSPRIAVSRAVIWLILLTALSLPFSGKGILEPILFWFGLRLFTQHRHVTLKASLVLAALVLSGAAVMVLLAYGASNFAAAAYLLGHRFWMSGDIYIYAYQMNALETIRGNYDVSFLPYMLNPLTALVGIRSYDKPLGAMLSSAVSGTDLVTGPNPQLPVLLDFFFPDQLFVTAIVSFVIGFLASGIRVLGITLMRVRSRHLRVGAIAAAAFAPAYGFLDTSQVLITVIGIAAATGCVTAIGFLISPGKGITTPILAPAPHATD